MYYYTVHGSTYSNCTDGQVKLIGGTTDYEGTVQICLNHAWGTITYYSLNNRVAQTICNSLGYTALGIHY